MPKTLNDLFASKNKTDSLDARIEAISRLFVEMLRTLQTKNIITADEVEDVFDRAAEQSFDDVESYIDVVYMLLNPPDEDESDSDESDLTEEDD